MDKTTNYNEAGETYNYFGQLVRADIGGFMPEKAVERKAALVQAIYQQATDHSQHETLRRYLGSIHHLNAFLLSVERIAEYVDLLKKNLLSDQILPEFPKIIVQKNSLAGPKNSPPCLIGISSTPIEIELETLLLRAVGLLERLSKQITVDCGLKPVKSYFFLERELTNTNGQDKRVPHLLKLVQKSNKNFIGLILSDGHSTSLRNIIAHKASSPEVMEKGFSINWPEESCLLAFDAEIDGYPLIGSVRQLALTVPFFAMECLRILLNDSSPMTPTSIWAKQTKLSEKDFEPTWQNPFIHYSHFIDPKSQGPLVSLLKWQPGGFQTHQSHLRDDIFDLCAKPICI